eukprot:4041684-Prorocentrum_lima.AAC.1
MDMTLSLAGMWIQGPWTSHTASFTVGLAGWHTSDGPTFVTIKEAKVLAVQAKWQQGPPNVCNRALLGDRGQDLFDCLAMFMGFVQAARPQHM